MHGRYCLVDEKWIPVAGCGRVSLIDIFQGKGLLKLDGNPIQIIAILKLLIAISYAALPLKDEEEWRAAGTAGLAEAAIRYLDSRRDCFCLYGNRPFLQMPQVMDIDGARKSIIHYAYIPDLASENDSILRQLQQTRSLTDAEKAVFLVTLMNYALGGKRTMKTLPLSAGLERSSSAKAAPSIGGFDGYLQTCLMGRDILESVYLNLPTDADIDYFPNITVRRPVPPWEAMPCGEDDERAREIKASPYSWYVSVSRFACLAEDGIYYAEGIQYPSVADGYSEPHITYEQQSRKALYTNPAKKPWRSSTALLQAAYEKDAVYTCLAMLLFFERARKAVDEFTIWAGGLKVSATSGDQSVKRQDDYVLSEITVDSKSAGEDFYRRLCNVIEVLEKTDSLLRRCVAAYFESMGIDPSSRRERASRASSLYWEYADRVEESIFFLCQEGNQEGMESLETDMWRAALQVYDEICPAMTAREIMANAGSRPRRKDVPIK